MPLDFFQPPRRLGREEGEVGRNILNQINSGQGFGREETFAPGQISAAQGLLGNQTPRGQSLGPDYSQAIAQAQANNMMYNGMPVLANGGKLSYDLEKIGAMYGLSPEQVASAKGVNFGTRSLSTGDQLSDLAGSGGRTDSIGGLESSRRAQWNKAGGSLSPAQAIINNLSGLDPLTSKINLSSKDMLANLQKPGFMADFQGDATDRLNQGQGPSGIGKYARYAVPGLAGLVIGAGALGPLFGAGGGAAAGAGGPGGAAGIGAAGGIGGATTFPAGAAGIGSAGGIGGATTFSATGLGAYGAGAAGAGGGAGISSALKTFGLPVAGAGASLGLDYLQGNQMANRAEDARSDARDFYSETSLPNQGALDAQGNQNRGALGQARLSAYQNLTKNLASRGFGSGSGLGIEGAQNIEGDYLRALGQSQTELTKFANTRQFPPGQDAYGYSVPGGSESAFNSGANMLNTTMGMYMANKMLNGD